MFKLFKYLFVTAFIFGGWTLASLSLHLVRTPVPSDKPSWLPGWVEFVPKSHMTWNQTWVDTTKWTANDLADHPELAAKLYPATRDAVVKGASARGIALPGRDGTSASTVSIEPAPSYTAGDTDQPKSKSIFDFRK